MHPGGNLLIFNIFGILGHPKETLNIFCWIHSTFTISSSSSPSRRVGVDVPHPGIGGPGGYDEEKRYVTYYKWVGFVLFFQALLFYLPRIFWKKPGGGENKPFSKGHGWWTDARGGEETE